MRVSSVLASFVVAFTTLIAAQNVSTQGLVDLVRRRIPEHVGDFDFRIANLSVQGYDAFAVLTLSDGRVRVESSTLSGLARGLHRYLADVVNVDIYWFIGSRLHLAPTKLPRLNTTLTGASIVPWRYHFNTVTFSYTAAWWTWEDWELELDWLALRGVNLPLAWVGQEKIAVEVFREIGLTDDEISAFLSGPAFQAWNRFGNIQGSWGGSLPMSWIDDQFEMQKKIVKRMVELGMTPALPSFTGFVPRAITRVLPDATVVNGSAWDDFPSEYTNVTFLEPFDDTFATLQKSFIEKQAAAYGNVSHIYTLDQYNENDPYSGDLTYLNNVTYNTWKSLKAADADAVWLMQGWLFFAESAFWTDERIEAYLSGVENDDDMLILDLFSESEPQWQNTNSYYGKPWIWCQLHDFGGSLGLYGQVENITINPIEALANSSTLVGFGLTMEGQEGNEIVYDLLLDQAWSSSPIEIQKYFSAWVTNRYAGSSPLPASLYTAWDIMSSTVYNNTNLTTPAVANSILEIEPSTYDLVNRTSYHITILNYDPATLVHVWNLLYNASSASPALFDNPAYQYDMVDVTRQVLSNAFIPLYEAFMDAHNATNTTTATLTEKADAMLALLSSLDAVLQTNAAFALSTWLGAARAWANTSSTTTNSTATEAVSVADFYEYDARNQITLWGPSGEITDYASKVWGGLVRSYYLPRWRIFTDYLIVTRGGGYNGTALSAKMLAFEEGWQGELWGEREGEAWGVQGSLPEVLGEVVGDWPGVFEDRGL